MITSKSKSYIFFFRLYSLIEVMFRDREHTWRFYSPSYYEWWLLLLLLLFIISFSSTLSWSRRQCCRRVRLSLRSFSQPQINIGVRAVVRSNANLTTKSVCVCVYVFNLRIVPLIEWERGGSPSSSTPSSSSSGLLLHRYYTYLPPSS